MPGAFTSDAASRLPLAEEMSTPSTGRSTSSRNRLHPTPPMESKDVPPPIAARRQISGQHRSGDATKPSPASLNKASLPPQTAQVPPAQMKSSPVGYSSTIPPTVQPPRAPKESPLTSPDQLQLAAESSRAEQPSPNSRSMSAAHPTHPSRSHAPDRRDVAPPYGTDYARTSASTRRTSQAYPQGQATQVPNGPYVVNGTTVHPQWTATPPSRDTDTTPHRPPPVPLSVSSANASYASSQPSSSSGIISAPPTMTRYPANVSVPPSLTSASHASSRPPYTSTDNAQPSYSSHTLPSQQQQTKTVPYVRSHARLVSDPLQQMRRPEVSVPIPAPVPTRSQPSPQARTTESREPSLRSPSPVAPSISSGHHQSRSTSVPPASASQVSLENQKKGNVFSRMFKPSAPSAPVPTKSTTKEVRHPEPKPSRVSSDNATARRAPTSIPAPTPVPTSAPPTVTSTPVPITVPQSYPYGHTRSTSHSGHLSSAQGLVSAPPANMPTTASTQAQSFSQARVLEFTQARIPPTAPRPPVSGASSTGPSLPPPILIPPPGLVPPSTPATLSPTPLSSDTEVEDAVSYNRVAMRRALQGNVRVHPSSGGAKSPIKPMFGSVRYLTPKRHRTVSTASMEAVDGTAVSFSRSRRYVLV
jgi:hypothetical protein